MFGFGKSNRRLPAQELVKSINPNIMQNQQLFPLKSLKSCDEFKSKPKIRTIEEENYLDELNDKGKNAMIEIINYYTLTKCIYENNLSQELLNYLDSIKKKIKTYSQQDNTRPSAPPYSYSMSPSAPPLLNNIGSSVPYSHSMSPSAPPLPNNIGSSVPYSHSMSPSAPPLPPPTYAQVTNRPPYSGNQNPTDTININNPISNVKDIHRNLINNKNNP